MYFLPYLGLYILLVVLVFIVQLCFCLMSIVILGDYSTRVPPLPIPNREVKPCHADGTAHNVGE